MLVTDELRVSYVCTVPKRCVQSGPEWRRVRYVLFRCVLSESQ